MVNMLDRTRRHPRPISERDTVVRHCVQAVLSVQDLCGVVAQYAREFQGLEYDPVRPVQLACEQQTEAWLRSGPLPTDDLRRLVCQYGAIDIENHPTHRFHGPLCVLPDGRVASGSWDFDTSVWGGADVLMLPGSSSPTSAFANSPCGSKLAIGSVSGLVRVWDLVKDTCQIVAQRSRGSVLAMAFLTDGKLAVSSSANDVLVWDVDRMVCVWEWIPTSAGAHMYALIPLDDGKFASASGDNAVRLWDVEKAVVQTLLVHRGSVYTLVVLPGGLMASGSYDRKVIIWDGARGLCVRCLEGHTGAVDSLAELPAGRLASGARDHTVRVWHVMTGLCLNELKEHTGPVRTLAVLPDGKLASGSDDQTVRVWDQDGKCVHILRAHTHGVTRLAVLQQGQLVSGGFDSRLYTWL